MNELFWISKNPTSQGDSLTRAVWGMIAHMGKDSGVASGQWTNDVEVFTHKKELTTCS